MNDQTSPTADGQGPGSSPWRNPHEEPQSAQGLPAGAAGPWPAGAGGPAGQPGYDGYGEIRAAGWPGGYGPSGASDGPGAPGGLRSLTGLLLQWRSDLLAAALLTLTGAVLGVPAGLAWYRFAPTVWLTLPANAVPQVTSSVDQSALLVEPEGKGIASVDGYYFVITSIVGLLLGVLGFYLARRGFLGGRDRDGERDGAAVGAWAGILLGGLAASTVAAAIGRWVSMPDPLTVLHIIAAGHNFHAPVALRAQGLYLAAPLLGVVLFLALTVAFVKPAPPRRDAGQRGYFTADNPYGFGTPSSDVRPDARADVRPDVQPDARPDGRPDARPDARPADGAGDPGATPGAASGVPQAEADTSLGGN